VGEPGARGAHLTGTPEGDWSILHHGLDPARVPFLRGWLRAVFAVGRPFAALRVPPTALTVVGVVFALDALLIASHYPLVALALVLASVACDALDGAVAVLTARASALGSVADKAADRISDTAFALVIWRCGAPLWLAVVAGALSLLHEGLRVRLGGARLSRITVAERPSRVICTVLAGASPAVSDDAWPPTVCAAVWCGLALIGLAQLRHP
jgi:CDP-diacylglycerol--glycerol-3-phosphate 3-phosphatidyltransferase